MIRAHKTRLNPTPEQEVYLNRCCGIARFAFNWGLARWKEQKANGVASYGAKAIRKEFNSIKHEQFPWATEVTKSAAECGFERLEVSLKNYFDSKAGKRKGERIGFPCFRSKKRGKQSFSLNWDAVKEIHFSGNFVRLPKVAEPFNMAEPLRFDGKVKKTTISKHAGHWWISVQIEFDAPEPIEYPHESIGIDLGVKTLVTLSDGKQHENQALLRRKLNKLRKLNRSICRRKQGSSRWYRAKDKLAKFHERTANQRNNTIHTITKQLTTTYETICVEDLNIKGMMRNRKLSLSLADASMGEVLRQLEYKAEYYGGRIAKVGRFFTSSKLCSDCGYVNRELTLSDRHWVCLECGVIHDRDHNAAINIQSEALRLAVV